MLNIKTSVLFVLFFTFAFAGVAVAQDAAPELPGGLDVATSDNATSDTAAGVDLPSGLALDEEPAASEAEIADAESADWLEMLDEMGFSGFVEGRVGMRPHTYVNVDNESIMEARLRVNWRKRFDDVTVNLSGDLLYDYIEDDLSDVDFVTGNGWFDLREAWVAFSPKSNIDVKIGRQVLTWGTGDLLFVNDLFPKDWQSFFSGRDLEYLKAPSDAIKVSIFDEILNVDLVYMPRFNPSRGITGERMSYYNPMVGAISGSDAVMDVDSPDSCFSDDEFAIRLNRRVGSYELAAYGYWGYWGTPEGMDVNGVIYYPGSALIFVDPYYPELNVYGLSARGAMSRGVANMELAYYDSPDDSDGDNPLVRNSEIRLLAGYETDLPEIASDLTVAVQYYLEYMMQYDDYESISISGMPHKDQLRHVTTLRLTKLLMNQNLELSFFAYYSPSDIDAYLRPLISYKIDDHWSCSLGGNIFVGKYDNTFFGQFEHNDNVFASLRWAF